MGNHRESSAKKTVTAPVRARRSFAFLRSRFEAFVADEQGQAVLEYMLILMATVVGAGLMSRKILETIDKGILKLGGQLEKDLKTGRLPLEIWRN
jgi:Flp pilus assembly pilin Flp